MKYHIVTLGCQMNKSDSERVRTVLEGMGYTWTDEELEADVLGILACSVRQKAIDRVYTRIHVWNEMKAARPVLTFVTGCVLPADRKKFLKLFDFVFTMNELPGFPEMIRQYGVVTPAALNPAPGPRQDPSPSAPAGSSLISIEALTRSQSGSGENREVMDGLWKIDATPESGFSAFVPIQNGCDKFCTFCAVPYTRGREVSRPSREILEEVESLIAAGYKSITLLGQNVNSYGQDRPGSELSFAGLLDAIGQAGQQADGPLWVYFTSPHPRDMTRDVLEVMAAHRCIGRQVHLPLQSGDDRVLMRMNRQHSVSRYREVVHMIRDLLPDATLFTDIIVGFTGETDEQFGNTLKAIDEFAFNMIYVAQYSPRPGAASSRWKDDIPREIKRDRLQQVNDRAIVHSLAWNRGLVGQQVPVLVTGIDRKGESLTALTGGRVNVRIASRDTDLVGRVVTITVSRAVQFCLYGDLVPDRAGLQAVPV